MAVTGRTIGGAMGTQMPMPGWDDILLLGAQLNPPPAGRQRAGGNQDCYR